MYIYLKLNIFIWIFFGKKKLLPTFFSIWSNSMGWHEIKIEKDFYEIWTHNLLIISQQP